MYEEDEEELEVLSSFFFSFLSGRHVREFVAIKRERERETTDRSVSINNVRHDMTVTTSLLKVLVVGCS